MAAGPLTSRATRRVTIIASAFYPTLSRALIQSAAEVLRRAGIPLSRIQIVWAPGAFELPVLAARALRQRPRPDAVITLGALIRGETPQYEVIAHAAARALAQLSVDSGVPVTFGVIVAASMAQATARAAGGRSNRGAEAARAALETLRAMDHLR